MNIKACCLIVFFIMGVLANSIAQANQSSYLDSIKVALKREWPKNRTINLVFHGHSVPSGYFKTPFVNTLHAYPFLAFKAIKEKYPNAVINFIVTGIGGENSLKGEKRFDDDVLTHKPDVLFIDYALNDLSIGVEKSKAAMSSMIEKALAKGIKVILLTPSLHQNYNILDPANPYVKIRNEFADLARQYHVGLVDSFTLFKEKIAAGHNIKEYMSQVNHPNEVGHQIIADEIVKWF